MPYSRELLDSALALCAVDPATQANRRRAVSTAYYALFHFLIEEACGNWSRQEQRSKLARAFDHRSMLDASNRRVREHKTAPLGSMESHLFSVADAFGRLQQQRHIADYDLSKTWSHADVEEEILLVLNAFKSWDLVGNEQIAQDYLFSLLFRDRS